MQVQQLRFPAQFKGTNEPVLLQGSLVLLSPAQITRAVQSVECKLSSIPTQTLRLYVYKDQWEGSWEDFCAQPVRSLLQQIPLLQLCRDQACGEACPKYHAAVDEPLDNLLMDLWARSWHRSDSKYTKPEHAAYWSVLVRIPISANLTIQGQSGVHGFFAEPRTASGKEVDDSFGMIWLGELSLPDICHRLKTTQGAIAIGRLRSKFGLRFRAADLEQGFAQLKPSEPFVGAKMQQVYRLYPLPFGTQRAALQKCLTDWGWTAKVRQSVGGGDAGMAWEVGAASDPPSPILSLPDGKGDVAITLQKAVMKPSEPPALLASAATKKYLQTNQASSSSAQVDPWVQSDPWGNYRATTAPPRGTDKFQQLEDRLTSSLQSVRKEVAGASDVATDISALENRLQTSLLESVRQEFAGQWTRQEDQEMDGFQSNTNDRLQKLESGMSKLHATNQKFEGWFNQLHRADQTLSAQVEAVTQQVDQQGHRIEKINTDLVSQVGGLQTGLNTVQQDVSNGFTRMEALLEKRAKTSWLGQTGPATLRVPGLSQFWIFIWTFLFWLGSVSGLQLPGNVGSQFHVESQSPLISFTFDPSAAFWTLVPDDLPAICTDWHASSFWSVEGEDVHCRSCLAQPTSLRSLYSVGWLNHLVYLDFVPWGEALNPGPPLAINLANPTGIRGKEQYLLDLPRGITCVAETHLATPGIASSCRYMRSLAKQDQRCLRLLPGAAVPLRARSLTTGVWSGVMQLSDLPCHKLEMHWPNGEHSLGRVQTANFRMGNVLIQGTVLYGWSPGPTWPRAHHDLLRHLSTEVVHGTNGLRFICGDFNGDELKLPEMDDWLRAGWQEVQTLHARLTGDGPYPTCKGSTRPDRIFVSPELASYFVRCEVTDVFADHSVVTGHFALPGDASTYSWWPMPAKMPWSSIDIPAWHASSPVFLPFAKDQDTTDYLSSIGQQYEASVKPEFVSDIPNGLPRACRGRAQHHSPVLRPRNLKTLRPSRNGEEKPRCDLVSHSVQRWFRQLRRIQS